MTRFFLIIILFFFSEPGYAKTYKWADGNGTLHFSNRPPVSKKHLKQMQTTDPWKFENDASGKAAEAEKALKQISPGINGEIVLYQDDKPWDLKENKLLKVILIKEKENRLLFDVEYNYIDTGGKAYPGIFPDMSHWVMNSSPITPGKNKTSVQVGLQDGAPDIIESDDLRLEMRWYKDGKYMGQLFERIIHFDKTWKKMTDNIN